MKTYIGKSNNKVLKQKQDNSQIDKIIKVNKQFSLFLTDLQKHHDLTAIEITNLENMQSHYENLNTLFKKFKK